MFTLDALLQNMNNKKYALSDDMLRTPTDRGQPEG